MIYLDCGHTTLWLLRTMWVKHRPMFGNHHKIKYPSDGNMDAGEKLSST